VWYDNRATDLTADGMKRGVMCSDVFVLFLSSGVMSRPFVHLVRVLGSFWWLGLSRFIFSACLPQELREAIMHKRKLVLLHEQDQRFHAVDFAHEKSSAPADLKYIFDDLESIAWRRRSFERDAMLHELCHRAGEHYEEHYIQRRKTEVDLTRSQQRGAVRRCSAVDQISTGAGWFQKKVRRLPVR
jgi:hypothetical protein